MPDPQTLAQKWRAKYGSAYDDLSDTELEAKIDAKYPGAYDDLPRTAKIAPGTMARIPWDSLTPEAKRQAAMRGEMPIQQTGLPELAAEHPIATTAILAAAAGGPAVARAAVARGVPLAARAVPVATAAIEAAAPALKYELAKSLLTGIGVPNSVAVPAAVIVSGLKRPAKAAPIETPTPKVAPAPAVEPSIERMNATIDAAKAKPVTVRLVKPPAPEPAAAPAPKAEPMPPPKVEPASQPAAAVAPKTTLTPPQIASQLDQAARRANFTPTTEQHQAAYRLVRDGGLSPTAAVLKIKAATRDVNAAAALLKIPGFMSEEQMHAEIAARVGNRSPKR